MIAILLHTYANLLIPIAVGAVLLFLLGAYAIMRLHKSPLAIKKEMLSKPMAQAVVANGKAKSLTAKQLLQDLTAIAGEDILLTQLDLARAYIDSGKKELAKNILNNVLAQGGAVYKQEAKQLLNCI